VAFAHACLRRAAAWREQLLAIAVFAVTTVVLNGATTGGSRLPPVLRVDIALLALSGAAWRTARRIGVRNTKARHA
jgi:hypothetical protein